MRLAGKAFGTRKPVFLAVPRIVPKLTLFETGGVPALDFRKRRSS